jgi:serine/threonine-protein kinase
MLKPDPKDRLRSMDEVLGRLERLKLPPEELVDETIPPVPVPPPAPDATVPPTPAEPTYVDFAEPGGGGSTKPLLIILAGLLVFAAALAVTWYLTDGNFGFGGGNSSQGSSGSTGGAGPRTDGRPPVEIAQATMNSVLPNVGCTWLDVSGIEPGPPVAVALRGVAGNVPAARGEVSQALTGAGLTAATTSFGDVATIAPAGCAALDAYRQIRHSGSDRISTSQRRYELTTLTDGASNGRLGAQATVEINTSGAADFALVGLQPSGILTPLFASRAEFLEAANNPGLQIAELGNGRYRLTIDVTHDGWSGLLLLTGNGPFDRALIAPPLGERSPDWRDRFAAASNGNWQGDMVWFQTVDRQPG